MKELKEKTEALLEQNEKIGSFIWKTVIPSNLSIFMKI
ncbi:Uncharacterised protein [Listeria grayi]|uniref:Uncharacterized protein n=1 Tax=Listeria grayi TaxID=1641 RepID=A0A378M8T2_LISGR|nr:Uncharacterised protein [Listeria grayi]